MPTICRSALHVFETCFRENLLKQFWTSSQHLSFVVVDEVGHPQDTLNCVAFELFLRKEQYVRISAMVIPRHYTVEIVPVICLAVQKHFKKLVKCSVLKKVWLNVPYVVVVTHCSRTDFL